MIKYTIQRVLYGLVTLFLVVTLTFLLMHMLPGSPFNDQRMPETQKQTLNRLYGFDKPLPVQYINYMGKVIRGDFGLSFKYSNQSVSKMIADRLPATAQVGSLALFVGTIIGIFLGALAALKRNSFWDYFSILIAIIGVSVPSFVIAAILQLWLGVKLDLLPIMYKIGNPLSIIMPAISLSVFVIASAARFMRTELVEVLSSDYILLARAKGLSKNQVIYKHALRNALIPVITVVGPMTISLLTGSTVVEKIFGIPGVSFLLIEGITLNDYFIILGVATFYSALFIFVIIIIDILYGIIDPRIRLAGGAK